MGGGQQHKRASAAQVNHSAHTWTTCGVAYKHDHRSLASNGDVRLQVAMKDTWPPNQPKNVETIAASYVPPLNGSKVRLFNLAVVSTASRH
jgi:hypothetical protein|eukprot:COSAG01_NODE_9787_length_2343_cov_6.472816_2_plen_91_part_00